MANQSYQAIAAKEVRRKIAMGNYMILTNENEWLHQLNFEKWVILASGDLGVQNNIVILTLARNLDHPSYPI